MASVAVVAYAVIAAVVAHVVVAVAVAATIAADVVVMENLTTIEWLDAELIK